MRRTGRPSSATGPDGAGSAAGALPVRDDVRRLWLGSGWPHGDHRAGGIGPDRRVRRLIVVSDTAW